MSEAMRREFHEPEEEAPRPDEMARWQLVSAAKDLLVSPVPLTPRERVTLDLVVSVFDWVAPVTSDAPF
jgi:hypothetical protein